MSTATLPYPLNLSAEDFLKREERKRQRFEALGEATLNALRKAGEARAKKDAEEAAAKTGLATQTPISQ